MLKRRAAEDTKLDVVEKQGSPGNVLVVSLAGIRFATRPRKTARELSRFGPVRYLALQSSGRGGRVDQAGVFDSDGVSVHQVRVRPRRSSGTLGSKLSNLIFSYLPAFLRLFRVALKSPAEVIVVANPVLAPIAIAHGWRYGSRAMIDIAERPGAVTASDSLASVFSRFEPIALRTLARRKAIATVAVPSDVDLVRGWGFNSVLPLRNAPLGSWRAPYADPIESDEFRCVVIGSVFAGRAYEILIRALAICAEREAKVRLTIVGPGTPEYLDELRSLTHQLGADSVITWSDAVDGDEVSATYLNAHVGIVLYEPDDPGNDGLSNKILECVSSGRPVLAGDLPENRSFVTENDVGWLTTVSPEAIADALIEIRGRADLIEVSRRCRALGDTSLTWESDFAQVRDVLTLASR